MPICTLPSPKPTVEALQKRNHELEKVVRSLEREREHHPVHDDCPVCRSQIEGLRRRIEAYEQGERKQREIVHTAVAQFAQVMEIKLGASGLTTHQSHEASAWLMRRLERELNELAMAMVKDEDVLGEAADVADVAMLIAESHREPVAC